MKKSILFVLFAVIALCFVSCSGDDENGGLGSGDKDVEVYITYTLDTANGEDMNKYSLKSSSGEVFDLFYDKMKTGELVSPTYELTFTEETTGAKYYFSGKWEDADMVTLKTGVYTVTGKSTCSGDYIQEKASLVFNEQITIDANTHSVKLNAQYDCFLLIFSKSNIIKLLNYDGIVYPSGSRAFFTFDKYYYAYVNNNLYRNESEKKNAYIYGERDNYRSFKIYTGNFNFEKGKYYIYNDISNSFTLPAMEDGNNL